VLSSNHLLLSTQLLHQPKHRSIRPAGFGGDLAQANALLMQLDNAVLGAFALLLDKLPLIRYKLLFQGADDFSNFTNTNYNK
jgi:hypothetical protein